MRVPEDLSEEPLIIPFGLQGVTAYFTVSKPTRFEYEDDSIPKINMTAEDLPWEPNSTEFHESESAMTDFRGQVVRIDTSARDSNKWVVIGYVIVEDERITNMNYEDLKWKDVYQPRNANDFPDAQFMPKRLRSQVVRPKHRRRAVKRLNCRRTVA